MAKVTAMTKITALEGKRDEVVALLTAAVEAANAGEPGTELYVVNVASRDPDVVFLFEMFTDKDALRAHLAYTAELMAPMAGLVSAIDVTLGNPHTGKGLAF